MNQLIVKYKQRIAPFLNDIFMPVVQTIIHHLEQPFDPANQEVTHLHARTHTHTHTPTAILPQALREHHGLQKSYFLFLNSLATNNVICVLETQSEMETHYRLDEACVVPNAISIFIGMYPRARPP